MTGPRFHVPLADALAAQAVDREQAQHRLRVEQARSQVVMRYRWRGFLAGYEWRVVNEVTGVKYAVGTGWTEARMLRRLERAYELVLDKIARGGAA